MRYTTGTQKSFSRKNYFVVVEEEHILGCATVFRRMIPAPVSAEEAFIYVIDVFEEGNHKKGLGSLMVQKILEIERGRGTYQVRAYCDIGNVASHALWMKNRFGISPSKDANGNILGSFVTYVL